MASSTKSLLLCVCAGFLGACGPVFVKLAGYASARASSSSSDSPISSVELLIQWFPVAACYAGLISTGIAAVSVFFRAMEGMSSLSASVVNGGSAILSAGLLGLLLLGEPVSARWCLGAMFLCIGLALVNAGAQPKKEEESKEE